MGEKLVPRTHERSELGHTLIRHFSSEKERAREIIPVTDSLGKETTFIGLKCHRLIISIMPSLGDKVLALPVRPMYSNRSIIRPT